MEIDKNDILKDKKTQSADLILSGVSAAPNVAKSRRYEN
jgi:hypothetical protein